MFGKKVVVIAAIILASIVTADLILANFITAFRTSQINSSIPSEIAQRPLAKVAEISPAGKELQCEDGWDSYNHLVLGIKFCYPHEWGAPETEPVKEITKLDGAVYEYSSDETNLYSNSIFISFPGEDNNKSRPSLRIFNNKYRGEFYPNSYAYEAGYIDNIPELKSTGDICSYRIDFNRPWKYNNKMNEIWSYCKQGVKTDLIEHTEHFASPRYSYDLNLLAYRKLANGYFDNLLIKENFNHITQNKIKLADLDQFFSKASRTKEEFENEQADFSKFIKSIQIYKPETVASADFQSISGEDPNITAIRKFYWLLNGGKLDEAYAMYSTEDETSFEKFTDWYKNLKSATPRDFSMLKSKNYDFYVDYRDHNSPETKYRVQMFVSDGKVKTLSSIEITSEEVAFGEYSAFATKKDGRRYLILSRQGKEQVIDEGEADYNNEESNITKVKFFSEPRFSPKGNYLIYAMSGWEWGSNYVYDIKNSRKILTKNGPSAFEFTPDEKYFYTCGSSGMGSDRAGEVLSVPGFKSAYNVFSDSINNPYQDVSCSYDNSSQSVTFTLGDYPPEDGSNNPNGQGQKVIIYSILEGKAVNSQ